MNSAARLAVVVLPVHPIHGAETRAARSGSGPGQVGPGLGTWDVVARGHGQLIHPDPVRPGGSPAVVEEKPQQDPPAGV